MTTTKSVQFTTQSALKGALIVAIGAFFVGAAPIGARLSELGPQATAFWRFTLSLPLLFAFARVQNIPISRPEPAALAVGFFFALDIAFWHAALTKTSVANATFIVNIGAVAAGLVAWAVLGHRPKLIWPLAACLALGGAAAMSFGAAHEGVGSLEGDLLALCAATSLSIYFVLLAVARSRSNAVSVLVWATAFEVVFSAGATLVMREPLIPPNITALGWPLFLAVFAHCLGQGLIIYGAGLAPPSVTGVIVMMQPVFAGFVAWPLFNEPLTLIQLIGGAAILVGVWLAGKR